MSKETSEINIVLWGWKQRQTLNWRTQFPEGWRGPGGEGHCTEALTFSAGLSQPLGLCGDGTEEVSCPPHGLPTGLTHWTSRDEGAGWCSPYKSAFQGTEQGGKTWTVWVSRSTEDIQSQREMEHYIQWLVISDVVLILPRRHLQFIWSDPK